LPSKSKKSALKPPCGNSVKKLLDAARRRDIDVVVVWRLDRWGRSMADLVTTLQQLRDLAVGFVFLTEALDLTTPSGRAMAGLIFVRDPLNHLSFAQDTAGFKTGW
jgi:Resolvase, N terminal domain